MGWDQLTAGIELPFDPDLTIPDLHEVTLAVPSAPAIDDVEQAAFDATIDTFRSMITSGAAVAVGAGSRGLSGRVEMLRGAIRGLRELGASPFVVPAMGSHGGATADGQVALLAELGITAESVGAPIRATMETVVVATTATGIPVRIDARAAEADFILPVNRVKPHTSFTGSVESGCTKMAVVGFGKQPGATWVHSCGPIEMRTRLTEAIDALRASGRLLGGIASVESPTGGVVRVAGLSAADVGGAAEEELTELARRLTPALPFDEIDVLIVERGGKDISGTTIDPNVTGRFWLDGLDDLRTPRVTAIVLLDLTEISRGNALGIGFADFVPAELAARIDWRSTYVNTFTTGPTGLRRSRMPMVLPDETACIKAALSMCGRAPDEPKRVVRIESTLHLTRCWVSAELLDQVP